MKSIAKLCLAIGLIAAPLLGFAQTNNGVLDQLFSPTSTSSANQCPTPPAQSLPSFCNCIITKCIEKHSHNKSLCQCLAMKRALQNKQIAKIYCEKFSPNDEADCEADASYFATNCNC